MYKSEKTKKDMMQAVIELIDMTGSVDFTINQIASRANVAVGLINYHYESKKDLIIDAVKQYIEESISEENLVMQNVKLEPETMLKKSFMSYADFLVKHQVISQMYIKYCFDGVIEGGSLEQAVGYYIPLIGEMNHELSEEQIMVILKMISSTIQTSFLETHLVKVSTGFDFFDKGQRDKLIHDMIALIFKK